MSEHVPDIPGYVVLGQLGAGGMGEVYLARQEALARQVAVKVLRACDRRDNARKRFDREMRHLAHLSHPAIVRVYDLQFQGPRPYITMEYVDGGDLDALLDGGKKLSRFDSLRIGHQIAWGLAYLHEQGIVHRDIKPRNILMTSAGQAKITDFGLARSPEDAAITAPDSLVGTFLYFSPEMAQDRAADRPADIYALGIILFRMLSGAMPYAASSRAMLLEDIAHGKRLRLDDVEPGLPPEVVHLVEDCLSLDPAARPTAARAAARLEQLMSGPAPCLVLTRPTPRVTSSVQRGPDPTKKSAVSTEDSPERRPRQGRWLLATTHLLVMGVTALVTFFLVRSPERRLVGWAELPPGPDLEEAPPDDRALPATLAKLVALRGRFFDAVRYSEHDILKGRTVSNPGAVKPILIDIVREVTRAIEAADARSLDIAGWLELEEPLHESLHVLDLMSPSPRRGEGALGGALQGMSAVLASTATGAGGRLVRRALAAKLDSVERLDLHHHKRHAERLVEIAADVEKLSDEELRPDLRVVEATRLRNRACDELQMGYRRVAELASGPEMAERMRALSAKIVDEGLDFLDNRRGERAPRTRMAWIVLDELERGWPGTGDPSRGAVKERAWNLLTLLREEHPMGDDLWRFHRHGRTFGLVR